ncbi:MAG: response regulator transcription factor [Chloroflexaceae bacterium]|nr:response regulator transcription factor [Chloroflexaceae bacterium]
MDGHILLVEDDTTACMLLADVLQGAGYRVTTAHDGETALNLLTHCAFDAVVTDIRMRDVDGVQVLQAATEREIPPPVLLLTGYGSLETAVAALRSGAFDYLLKPVAPENLLQRVEEAIQRYQTKRRQDMAIRVIEQGLAQFRNQEVPVERSEERSIALAPGQSESARKDRYVHIGLLHIDHFRHTALFDGKSLHITPIEYALLRRLAQSVGQVVSYCDIVRATHGHDTDDAEAQSLLKAHIRNLRRKLSPDYLVNVRGTGYMLVDPESTETL